MRDYLDSLDRLASLFERGIITQEEFERQKNHLLTFETPLRTDPARGGVYAKNKAALAIAGVAVLGAIALLSFVGVDLSQRLSTKADRTVATQAHLNPKNTADQIVSFASTSACKPSDRFQNLLSQIATAATTDGGSPNRLIVFTNGTDPLPVSATSLNGVTLGQILPNDRWKGLNLVSVRQAEWATGSGFQLRFRNPLSVVQRELMRSGFGNIPAGSLKKVEDVFLGLEEVDGSVALTCMKPTAQVRESLSQANDTEAYQ